MLSFAQTQAGPPYVLQVSSLSTGEIDCEDLRTRLMANRSKPAIINLNIGTFMQGAIDDVDKVWLSCYRYGTAHTLLCQV
jgi:histidine decarboxylase